LVDTAHGGVPAQAPIIQLLDALHAVHEAREFLELRPLVVGGLDGHVDVDGMLDPGHTALLPEDEGAISMPTPATGNARPARPGAIWPKCGLRGVPALRRMRARRFMRRAGVGQKRSLSARTAANSAVRSPAGNPGTRFRTDASSSGLSARRNGFVAFSSSMVLGIVGLPARRSARTAASFACRAAFPGSRVAAKSRFFSVYS